MVSTLAAQLYVLRGAMGGVRSDNFVGNDVDGVWALVNMTKSITDGDEGTFAATAASGTATKTFATNRDSTVYKYLVAKLGHTGTGAASFIVRDSAGTTLATLTLSSNQPETIMTATLIAGNGLAHDFRISVAVNTENVFIDWAYLCSNTYIDLSSKLRGYDTDDKLGWQTGEATFEIQDENGFLFTSPNIVQPGDIVAFYESADGTTFVRGWGGSIYDLDKRSAQGERITTIHVHNWNKALEATEVFNFFGGQTDDTIVGTLVDKINTGSVTPQISGWNFAKKIDQLSAVTAAFEWRQIDVNRALTELSDWDSAQVGGNGADFYCSFAEVFNWHQILNSAWGSAGSYSDTSPNADFIRLDLHYHDYDIRTELSVFGNISLVDDGDAWTESNDVWTDTPQAGNYAATRHSFFAPTGITNLIGTHYLLIDTAANPGKYATGNFLRIYTTTNLPLDTTKIGTKSSPPVLVVNHMVNNDTATTNVKDFVIILETSANNYFQITLPNANANVKTFTSVTIPIGPWAKGGTGSLQWIPTGTPDWTNITKIYLQATVIDGAQAQPSFRVDGFDIQYQAIEVAVDNRTGKGEKQFGRRSYTAFDPMPRLLTSNPATPQTPGGKPGLRELAFIMMKKWRDPINDGTITFDATAANGILTATPGQKITLTSAHYNISAKDHRIIGTRHHWAKGDTAIRVILSITDFTACTQVRSPTDLWRELMQFDAVSRYNYIKQQSDALAAYNAGATTDVQRTVTIYTV